MLDFGLVGLRPKRSVMMSSTAVVEPYLLDCSAALTRSAYLADHHADPFLLARKVFKQGLVCL